MIVLGPMKNRSGWSGTTAISGSPAIVLVSTIFLLAVVVYVSHWLDGVGVDADNENPVPSER